MTFLPLIDATYFLLSNALDMDKEYVLLPDNKFGTRSWVSFVPEKHLRMTVNETSFHGIIFKGFVDDNRNQSLSSSS